ncbi:MAG: type II toxin-antitoxin system Phd/YefM family antitoxin, partial [Acidaminococcaceae bacterium]|nr:type II toxin-antitoxin system Phd/YefM family antitoxin [Acidaminococcaceae bacterium]
MKAGEVMTTMTPTALRKNLFEVFENTAKYNDVVLVTGKKHNVVIMSEDDYRGMMETMYLYSQPGVVEEIVDAMNERAAALGCQNTH